MLAAGAAWAVPTVVVSTEAPALAVSETCNASCPSMSFDGGYKAGGWSETIAGTYAPAVPIEFKGTYTPWSGRDSSCSRATGGDGGGSLKNVIVVEGDPVSWSTLPVVTYTKSVCLSSGYSYTFSSSWSFYASNRRAVILRAQLVRKNGTFVASHSNGDINVPTPQNDAVTVNRQGTGAVSYKPALSEHFDGSSQMRV